MAGCLTTSSLGRQSGMEAAVVLGSIAKSLLASTSSLKCVVDGDGSSITVSDVVEILKHLDIEHPVGQMISMACQSHQMRYGTGTKTLLVLIGIWMKSAINLKEQGVPLMDIIQLMHSGIDVMLKHLDEVKIPVRVDPVQKLAEDPATESKLHPVDSDRSKDQAVLLPGHVNVSEMDPGIDFSRISLVKDSAVNTCSAGTRLPKADRVVSVNRRSDANQGKCGLDEKVDLTDPRPHTNDNFQHGCKSFSHTTSTTSDGAIYDKKGFKTKSINSKIQDFSEPRETGSHGFSITNLTKAETLPERSPLSSFLSSGIIPLTSSGFQSAQDLSVPDADGKLCGHRQAETLHSGRTRCIDSDEEFADCFEGITEARPASDKKPDGVSLSAVRNCAVEQETFSENLILETLNSVGEIFNALRNSESLPQMPGKVEAIPLKLQMKNIPNVDDLADDISWYFEPDAVIGSRENQSATVLNHDLQSDWLNLKMEKSECYTANSGSFGSDLENKLPLETILEDWKDIYVSFHKEDKSGSKLSLGIAHTKGTESLSMDTSHLQSGERHQHSNTVLPRNASAETGRSLHRLLSTAPSVSHANIKNCSRHFKTIDSSIKRNEYQELVVGHHPVTPTTLETRGHDMILPSKNVSLNLTSGDIINTRNQEEKVVERNPVTDVTKAEERLQKLMNSRGLSMLVKAARVKNCSRHFKTMDSTLWNQQLRQFSEDKMVCGLGNRVGQDSKAQGYSDLVVQQEMSISHMDCRKPEIAESRFHAKETQRNNSSSSLQSKHFHEINTEKQEGEETLNKVQHLSTVLPASLVKVKNCSRYFNTICSAQETQQKLHTCTPVDEINPICAQKGDKHDAGGDRGHADLAMLEENDDATERIVGVFHEQDIREDYCVKDFETGIRNLVEMKEKSMPPKINHHQSKSNRSIMFDENSGKLQQNPPSVNASTAREILVTSLDDLASGLSHGSDLPMRLVLEVCKNQWDRSTDVKNPQFDKDRLHTCVIDPGVVRNCCVKEGLLVKVTPQHLGDSDFREINGNKMYASALLINNNLSADTKHTGYKAPIKNLQKFTSLGSKVEDSWAVRVRRRVRKLGVKVLLVKGSMDSDLKLALESDGVIIAENIRHRLLAVLAESDMSKLITYVESCTEEDLISLQVSILTSAGTTTGDFLVLKQHDKAAQALWTIVLSHPCKEEAERLEQQVWKCASRLSTALAEGYVLPGSGETERRLADLLSNYPTNDQQSTANIYQSIVFEALAEGLRNFHGLVVSNINSSYDEQKSLACLCKEPGQGKMNAPFGSSEGCSRRFHGESKEMSSFSALQNQTPVNRLSKKYICTSENKTMEGQKDCSENSTATSWNRPFQNRGYSTEERSEECDLDCSEGYLVPMRKTSAQDQVCLVDKESMEDRTDSPAINYDLIRSKHSQNFSQTTVNKNKRLCHVCGLDVPLVPTSDNVPSHNANVLSHYGSVLSHNDNTPSHNDNIPSHNDSVLSHNDIILSHNDSVPSHNDSVPALNANVPSHNANVLSHNNNVPSRYDGVQSKAAAYVNAVETICSILLCDCHISTGINPVSTVLNPNLSYTQIL